MEQYAGRDDRPREACEADVADILNSRRIKELGMRSQGEAMEIEDASLASIRSDLMRTPKRYVVLTRHGQVDGIVDRLDLSSPLAMQRCSDAVVVPGTNPVG